MAIRKEYNQAWNPFWLNMPDSGGSKNYEDLENKPSINDVELEGNKTGEDLGIDYVLPEASFSTLGGVKVGDVPAAQGFPVSIPKPDSGASYTWSGTAPIAGAEKVRLTAHFNNSGLSLQENYIFDIDLSKFVADNPGGVGATMAMSYNGGSGPIYLAMLRILITKTNGVKNITMIKVDLYEEKSVTIQTGEGPGDFVEVLGLPRARETRLPDAIAMDWVKTA